MGRTALITVVLIAAACGSEGAGAGYDAEATRACLKDLGANVTEFNDGGEAGGDVDRAFGFGFPERMEPKTLQFPSGDLLIAHDAEAAERIENANLRFAKAAAGSDWKRLIQRQDNAVVLWAAPSSAESRREVSGCLREAG